MKSILFVLRHTKEQFIHDKKYNGLIQTFRNKGFLVSYTLLTNDSIKVISEMEEIVINQKKDTQLDNKAAANIKLYYSLSRYLEKMKITYDIIYVRMMPATFAFASMFRVLKRHAKNVLVEIPSYPSSGESNTEKRLYRKMIYKFFAYNSKRISKYIDLYIVIGEDCKEYNKRRAINISNGIDIDSIKIREPIHSEKVHILALAKMARWHGYDRLIEGVKEYIDNQHNRSVVVHMVGNDGDGSLKKWTAMVRQYGLQDYFIFEGPLYGKELDEIFNVSSVAIASLGIHRKGAKVTSELKIREYCAKGIPFVYSTVDPDISPQAPFCIKVSADDSSVDIKKVVELALQFDNGEKDYHEIREYCQKYLTWNNQVEKIINALHRLHS